MNAWKDFRIRHNYGADSKETAMPVERHCEAVAGKHSFLELYHVMKL